MSFRQRARAAVKSAAKAVVQPLLRGTKGREAPARPLQGGLLGRTVGAALSAAIPKNASGNNASVR